MSEVYKASKHSKHSKQSGLYDSDVAGSDNGLSSARVNIKDRQQAGFTLLEVMVALAILAVVAVAASRASSAYLRSVDNLRTRTMAQFVAQNAAADMRINEVWLTGGRSQRISAQGREWQVTYTPSDTPSENLKRVNIAVAPIEASQVGNTVVDIDTVIANPEPAGLDASTMAALAEFGGS